MYPAPHRILGQMQTALGDRMCHGGGIRCPFCSPAAESGDGKQTVEQRSDAHVSMRVHELIRYCQLHNHSAHERYGTCSVTPVVVGVYPQPWCAVAILRRVPGEPVLRRKIRMRRDTWIVVRTTFLFARTACPSCAKVITTGILEHLVCDAHVFYISTRRAVGASMMRAASSMAPRAETPPRPSSGRTSASFETTSSSGRAQMRSPSSGIGGASTRNSDVAISRELVAHRAMGRRQRMAAPPRPIALYHNERLMVFLLVMREGCDAEATPQTQKYQPPSLACAMSLMSWRRFLRMTFTTRWTTPRPNGESLQRL